MAFFRDQFVPLLLAVLVHAAAVLALMGGFNPEQEVSQVIKPKIVNSTLLVLEPKAKPKVAPKPKAAEPKPQPPVTRPEPKPTPQPKAAPGPEKPRPDPDAIRKEAEARIEAQKERLRQERLKRLAEQSFADALAQEADALSDSDDDTVALSYQQGMMQLIVANWSRPPSARNGMKARLLLELVPTGDVVSVSIVESSGNAAFDRSAERAVRKAQRFEVPDDPRLFEEKFRRLYLLFQPEDLLR